MTTRAATHAGSWYYSSPTRLETQIGSFLKEAKENGFSQVKGARFVVGPHAGYAYAGRTLAETYSAWDTEGIKRLFILGPSHHVYFRGAQLTPFSSYETPLGDVPVDRTVVDALRDTGIFQVMTPETDEEEHSFEMHMPFIYKMSQGNVSIVPILVGNTDAAYDERLAKALSPYFQDKQNAFAISTDFCHWGKRFAYTQYTGNKDAKSVHSLRKSSQTDSHVPIYKSIEYLDRAGMRAASSGSYKVWNDYLKATENTICGRTPLGILIKTIELSDSDGKLQWMGYTQSSQVTDLADSSVSYASGYAVC